MRWIQSAVMYHQFSPMTCTLARSFLLTPNKSGMFFALLYTYTCTCRCIICIESIRLPTCIIIHVPVHVHVCVGPYSIDEYKHFWQA